MNEPTNLKDSPRPCFWCQKQITQGMPFFTQNDPAEGNVNLCSESCKLGYQESSGIGKVERVSSEPPEIQQVLLSLLDKEIAATQDEVSRTRQNLSVLSVKLQSLSRARAKLKASPKTFWEQA